MRYQTIFFDLDGTLTDSGEGIMNSVAYALREKGMPVPERRALRRFIGPPLTEELQDAFGIGREEAAALVAEFRVYFTARGIYENRLYDGVPEMLESLRSGGCRLVVATSKPEKFAVQILRRFGVLDRFAAVAGSTMDENRTAKDEVLAYAMTRAGVTGPEGCVMVGDRRHDVLGAKKNGMRAMGVLYGYGERAELEEAGADLIAETVSGVAPLLLGRE